MIKDKIIIYVMLFLTGIILGSIFDYFDSTPQEPALSRYCVNYCIKEQLELTKGDIEYGEIKDHCKDFFDGISCCKYDDKYGECSIKTLNKLQQKRK